MDERILGKGNKTYQIPDYSFEEIGLIALDLKKICGLAYVLHCVAVTDEYPSGDLSGAIEILWELLENKVERLDAIYRTIQAE